MKDLDFDYLEQPKNVQNQFEAVSSDESNV